MPTLYSIGHSTRSNEEFLELLKTYRITYLIDVRTIPKSRRMPWFSKELLAKSCRAQKIRYIHLPSLGGLRKPKKDSINKGWQHSGFRGFADYMETQTFFAGLKELNAYIKSGEHVAIMCAEALPWHCHRTLISDAETIRGIKVLHIFSKTNIRQHKLTAFAKIVPHTRPKKLYYPLEHEQLDLFG